MRPMHITEDGNPRDLWCIINSLSDVTSVGVISGVRLEVPEGIAPEAL
jgi:hypothetical protein